MRTPAGEIKITINGRETPYESTRLDNHARNYDVDGRYLLVCEIPEDASGELVVECFVESEVDINDAGSEPGERLALVGMRWGPNDANRMSIGTEGDIPGATYECFDYGIRMTRRDDPGRIVFSVAWVELSEPDRYDIQTWLAADLPWGRLGI